MKREQDLIRSILFEVEANEDFLVVFAFHQKMSFDERKTYYHALLAADAGLLEETGQAVFRLTNAGHDFIEATRDEGIWSRTKEAVAKTGGNATLEIVKQIALGFLKRQIKDKTGLDL